MVEEVITQLEDHPLNQTHGDNLRLAPRMEDHQAQAVQEVPVQLQTEDLEGTATRTPTRTRMPTQTPTVENMEAQALQVLPVHPVLRVLQETTTDGEQPEGRVTPAMSADLINQ